MDENIEENKQDASEQTDNPEHAAESQDHQDKQSKHKKNNKKPKDESQEEDSVDNTVDEEASKYQVGDIITLIRVRFPGNSKSFPFVVGERRLTYGQKVVAMSDRGVAVGYINSFPYQMVLHKEMMPLKSILRVASEKDLEEDQASYKQQKQTESLCIDLIEKHKLDMNLTHVEFTQFGKKVVFYFTAPARVDFRGLVKDLVNELKLRIELRQISVRDRSAAIGGLGPCGLQLCCSSFLSRYGNVNIKMAKNQDLTLSYNKLNGVCGQLKCCLQYEDEVYYMKRKKLPKIGRFIQTHSGDRGKVNKLHLLNEQFDLLTDKGVIKRFSVGQYKKDLDTNFRMPERFDHITNETSNVIGLTEDEQAKAENFEKEVSELTQPNITYSENIFLKHFGQRTSLEEEEYSKEVQELLAKRGSNTDPIEEEEDLPELHSHLTSEMDDTIIDDGDDDEDEEDDTFSNDEDDQEEQRSPKQNTQNRHNDQGQRKNNHRSNRSNNRNRKGGGNRNNRNRRSGQNRNNQARGNKKES